jgi:hypothetical protein
MEDGTVKNPAHRVKAMGWEEVCNVFVIPCACAWRIHKITQQSVSGTVRDSASASDTRQNLSATQVRQNPAGGLLTPRASGAH